MSTAVLDIGKTNVKLSVIDGAGRELARRQIRNHSRPGPPWLHPDLDGIEVWMLRELLNMARDHELEAFVATGHGSGGVLIGDQGAVLPSIDYEEQPPLDILEGYAGIVPSFPERGAPQLAGASHFGRQLYWIGQRFPEALKRARHFLALPHYFAWRLTGKAVAEVTMLGAQSHLWSPLRADWTDLIDSQGWRRLMPPIQDSWQPLGSPRHELGLPSTMQIFPGVHDSTANLYPYQCADLGEFVLLSTGTWIVGMSPATPHHRIEENRSMCVTSDVWSRPIVGTLTMTGREYETIAPDGGAATVEIVSEFVERETMVMPSFVNFDGIYPASAGRGRVLGPEPVDNKERTSLGTLYSALVAEHSLDLLDAKKIVVIDGSFVTESLFAALVATLRPDLKIYVVPEGLGTAGGAALLARQGRDEPVNLSLQMVEPLAIPGLTAYCAVWRERVEAHLKAEGI